MIVAKHGFKLIKLKLVLEFSETYKRKTLTNQKDSDAKLKNTII